MRAASVGRGPDRFGERRVPYDGVEQTSQAHERLPSQKAKRTTRTARDVTRAGAAHDTPDRRQAAARAGGARTGRGAGGPVPYPGPAWKGVTRTVSATHNGATEAEGDP
ncbi:hypothetical protein JCM4914_45120 [Streptomyces platensis subsp. malvinus]